MNTPYTDSIFGGQDSFKEAIQNVVWYHGSCLDGTCAAWVAAQYLPKETTHFRAMQYGDKMEDHMRFAKDKNLYILDWMPERMEDVAELIAITENLVIIDHHDSAIKKFTAYFNAVPEECVFLAHNNEWSGAMGTAIWFRDQHIPGKPDIIGSGADLSQHWLVQAIDDRDRWQFKLPNTKEINAGLFHMGFDLATWRRQPFGEDQMYGLIDGGAVLLEAKQKEIDLIIKSGLQFIDDHNDNAYAAIINAPYHLASEMGNQIVQDHKFRIAIIWNIDKSYKTYFSLRSNAENPHALNCAEIATKLGGGGHVNAAGAKMDMPYQMARQLLEEVLDSYE